MPPLDLTILTDAQRAVYPHWRAGRRPADIARATGLRPSHVHAIRSVLERIERTGGRRTSGEAIGREREIAAALANQPTCGRCGLSGPHVCTDDPDRYTRRRDA